MCHTQHEMWILVDGMPITSNIKWMRINDAGFSLTVLPLHSGINTLQLHNASFGASFCGQAEYESYAHLGRVFIPESQDNEAGVYPEYTLASWMPHIDAAPTGQADNSLDSELHLNKLIAGISVSVIVTIVLIAKVIACMVTLKQSGV